MDNIDLSILKCLKDNSRQTASTISQTINLSVSAVIERIRKMEAKGVIQQYTVVLDEKQLGMELPDRIYLCAPGTPQIRKRICGSGLRP